MTYNQAAIAPWEQERTERNERNEQLWNAGLGCVPGLGELISPQDFFASMYASEADATDHEALLTLHRLEDSGVVAFTPHYFVIAALAPKK